jgi:tetratricopeptide (TPR) repeat protein
MQRSRYRGFLYVLPWLLAMTQCAARAPALTPAELADAGRADALIRDGCYTCLQEATGIYTRLVEPVTRKAPDRVVRGAFEAAVLLAVREKELGLKPDTSLARARELAARLTDGSARAGAGNAKTDAAAARVSPAVLLEAAEAVFGDSTRLDAEERLDYEKRKTASPVPVADTSDPVLAYLAIAVHCDQPRGSASARAAAPAANLLTAIAKADNAANVAPLLRYRAAICSGDQPTTLTRMREADPRWTEIYFFEGKHEMGSPARAADPERAATLLTRAAAALPDSIAVRLMVANAHELAGDAAASLDAFDRVLAANPAHVDARLGRVRNLSYLARTDEAIATATILIDAGTWHVGDAYYWRAWNLYQTRRFDEAWADVRQSMSLLSNTAVYALAGSIAYARKELDTAVAHFNRAFEIDPSNCLAVWSAGLVHLDRAAWPTAAVTFSKSATCFATAAATARTELVNIEKAALAPAVKERRLASTRKRLASAEDLRGQAARHAARSVMYAWAPAFHW